ncbi:MAG: hypothetical protein EZS28_038694 [Streblomastix strix]|uniref:Uncharacterized protein n=1 Tax=Streblomastix strix TaxID=222440 RepID=A0A5J4U6E0_9EUKA|nr:MAG: hypothetical protein EZS28_038694 [Streblomastix strix]
MDIDMEQMTEMDLTQVQLIIKSGIEIFTAPVELGRAPRHARENIADVFAAQSANIQHMNDGNEIILLQKCYLAAQRADDFIFQPLLGQKLEQFKEEPEHDRCLLDLNKLPDNPINVGQPGLTEEARRSETNQDCIQKRSKSPCKKKLKYL